MKSIPRTNLAAGFILLTLLSTACGSQSVQATSTNQAKLLVTAAPTQVVVPSETSTLQPTSSVDEAKSVVVKALLALNAQANLMDVTTVLPDGTTQATSIEFVPPDRKHILDVSSGLEYLIVNGKVYSRSGPMAEWAETQIPASNFMGDTSATADSIGAGISDVKKLGSDTLNGKAVVIYAYNNTSATNGVELHNQSELWVGAADGLPYKMVVNGDILSASSDPTTGENKLNVVQANTTTEITFDPTLTIEAPGL